MIQLTAQQLADAKANDLAAVTAVLAETEERVLQIANKHAMTGGRLDAQLAEDLAQIGRIAVWECISTFQGSSVAEFFTYMDRTVGGALSNERKVATRQGVSRSVSEYFETALAHAGGDPYEAQQMVTRADVMGARKMSPETAYAARLAWQGCAALDAPLADSGACLADTLVADTLEDAREAVTARQRETAKAVHRTLDKLGVQARSILKGTYGIDGPTPYFGTENEEDFADYLGMARTSDLRAQRSKAKARFRTVYLAGEAAA